MIIIDQAGWVEWGYQKRNISHMRTQGVTQTVLDYLLWHHLGDDHAERAHDLLQVNNHYHELHHYHDYHLTLTLQVYKDYFCKSVNAANLAGLVEQYIWRTDITLTRDISEKNTLQAPVLNLVGIHSASAIIDETVTFNGRLTPTKTNWMKIQEAAMILEETPDKVCQALRLFLQGQGYCLSIRKNAIPL